MWEHWKKKLRRSLARIKKSINNEMVAFKSRKLTDARQRLQASRTLRAARKKQTEWKEIKATDKETPLILQEYIYEHGQLVSIERIIFEITKANFAAFGAILLIGSSSFFVQLGDTKWIVFIACSIVTSISLASAIMTVFYYKYVSVYGEKINILRKAIWRERPLNWIDLKYQSEGLPERFRDTHELGIMEFITYNYVMKYINLIPFAVATFIMLLVLMGIVHPPAKVTG